MKVLLIVDMQNDFCPGGALPVTGGDEIVPTINKLMESGRYDLVIASKDWHPAAHVSFAANHPGAEVFSEIETPLGMQAMWPVHCVEGSSGAEFHPGLNLSRINKVILKGQSRQVDSYSAFFDNAHLQPTEGVPYLIDACMKDGVDPGDVQIDICGLALDYCVYHTAMDAAGLGFNTSLLLSATRAVNIENVPKILHDLAVNRGVNIKGISIKPEYQVAV